MWWVVLMVVPGGEGGEVATTLIVPPQPAEGKMADQDKLITKLTREPITVQL